MFCTMDLQQVLRYQADLRRDADRARRVAGSTRSKEQTKGQPRRVFGLRLSLA